MSKTKPYSIVPDIPDELLKHYLKQDVIAVDSELHGLKLYRDQVCLVQLCDDQSNVCLVRPNLENPPKNLRKLMEQENIIKVFHFALTDVAFFKTSLQIEVAAFRCTKVMSKLVRTYTDSHGLKDLTFELLGMKLEKEQQQTNWASSELTPQQLKYAANDVLHLVQIYRKLEDMIDQRATLSTGISLVELNKKSQETIPVMVSLLVHGYGDLDRGWQTTLFTH